MSIGYSICKTSSLLIRQNSAVTGGVIKTWNKVDSEQTSKKIHRQQKIGQIHLPCSITNFTPKNISTKYKRISVLSHGVACFPCNITIMSFYPTISALYCRKSPVGWTLTLYVTHVNDVIPSLTRDLDIQNGSHRLLPAIPYTQGSRGLAGLKKNNRMYELNTIYVRIN